MKISFFLRLCKILDNYETGDFLSFHSYLYDRKNSSHCHRNDLESDPLLQYSVLVEKFDEKNAKIKIDLKVWEEIQAGVFQAFLKESETSKIQLFEECEKKFDSKRGEVMFFPKSRIAQDFIIKTINGSLCLPGVKARRPIIETMVSCALFFKHN